jgi:hypothetical protein
MHLLIDLSNAHDVPCDRCGWQDGRGGVELVDDQRVSKVFCQPCVLELVRKCLPDGRFASYETTPAAVAVALAS